MKIAVRFLMFLGHNALALVLTNGPDANVTAPDDPHVGWQFVADNGPYTACGPRLFCSVQHVSFIEPVYRGELYHIELLIEPPGSDVRFLLVDHDVPEYARLWSSTNSIDLIGPAYIVARGVGTGTVDGGTNFWWGAEGFWPDGTRRLRWSSTDSVILGGGVPSYSWRSNQCGASSGDSGYAAFAGDGSYIGPIQWGNNPMRLGEYQSGGAMAFKYLEWIRDYLPQEPPKPKKATNVTATRKE